MGEKKIFKGPWLSFKITKVIYLYFEKKIKSSWCVSHGPPSGNPNQPLESLEPEVLPYPLRPAAWRPFLRQAIPLPAGALYLVNTCRLFTASPQSVSLRPLPRVSHHPLPVWGHSIQHLARGGGEKLPEGNSFSKCLWQASVTGETGPGPWRCCPSAW